MVGGARLDERGIHEQSGEIQFWESGLKFGGGRDLNTNFLDANRSKVFGPSTGVPS